MKILLFFSGLAPALTPKDSVSIKDLKMQAYDALKNYNDAATDNTQFYITTGVAVLGVLVAVYALLPFGKENFLQKALKRINVQDGKRYFVIVLAIIFGLLLFAKATTLIFLFCAIVAVLALVVFVSVYCIKYFDELKNKPQKIVIEGARYSFIEEKYPFEYEQNFARLKSYFENRYVTSPVRIVYLFEEEKNEFVNKIYIAVEDDRLYERIKTKIDEMVKSKWQKKFFPSFPTIE